MELCSRSCLEFLSSAAWILAYLLGAFAVGVGVLFPAASWLCAAVFAASLASVTFHLVRASLTRRVLPVRLTAGANVVVLAAASLAKESLTTQASAAIVASVPLLSYFCLCGWRLALAPPRPGEAMRPETTLRQCHPFNRFAVTAVLLVEFIQFNALSFNPALGAWSDLRAVASQYYSFSFLIANGASSAEYFERQLWIFCSLAIGWVLFALVALSIVAHSRALATRRPDAADGLPPLGLTPQRAIGFLSYRTASTQMDHHHKPHQPAAAASSESLGDERGASGEYTMSSPVILVVSNTEGAHTHSLSTSPHRCNECPPSHTLSDTPLLPLLCMPCYIAR